MAIRSKSMGDELDVLVEKAATVERIIRLVIDVGMTDESIDAFTKPSSNKRAL